jgi:hypothetical protein
MDFPRDTQADLDAFYSKHQFGANGELRKHGRETISPPSLPLTLSPWHFHPVTGLDLLLLVDEVSLILLLLFNKTFPDT